MSYTRKFIHPLEEQLNEAKEDGQVKELLEKIIAYKPTESETQLPRLDVALDIALEKQKYQVILSLPPSPLIEYMSQAFLHGYHSDFYSFLKSRTDLPKAHFYLGLRAYTKLDRNLSDAITHLETARKDAADWFPSKGYHILGSAYFFGDKENSLLAAQFFQEAILKSNGEIFDRWYRPYQELIILLEHAYGLEKQAERKWDAVRQAKDVAPASQDYMSKFTDAAISVLSLPFTIFSSAPTLADSAPKEIAPSEVLRIIYNCLKQEKNPQRLYTEARFDILAYLSDHVFDKFDFFATPEEAARWAETLAKVAVDSKLYDKVNLEQRTAWSNQRLNKIPKELELQKQLLLEYKSKKQQKEISTVESKEDSYGLRRVGKF